MSFLNDWKIILLLCLTLGLAPFLPEPHIWGKTRWIMDGARGMAFMDWIDVFFHGLPFLLLFRKIILSLFKK